MTFQMHFVVARSITFHMMQFGTWKEDSFSKAPKDDRILPDMHLGLYDDVIVFDHMEKRVYAIHWVRLDRYSSVEKAHTDGVRRLEKLVARVHDIDVWVTVVRILSMSTFSFCSFIYTILIRFPMVSHKHQKGKIPFYDPIAYR